MTRNIHLPAYKRLTEEITIVGGCDPDDYARKTASSDFGLKDVFADSLEMIKATAPDIVSVCTPPALHVEQTFTALEHGCHVFCEKPLADDLTAAAELVRVAARSKGFVVVNNQFPYMNIHRAAKQFIGLPEFGNLLFLQAWQTLPPVAETDWRGSMKRRLCFEFGVHVFELARCFFEAEPVWISALMPQPAASQRYDALNVITLEFADGRAASLILNRLSKGPERYLDMRLDGEFASISTSIGGKVGLEAGIHTRDKRPFLGINFIKGGSAYLQKGNKSRLIAKDNINPFASATAYHFGNFIAALRKGTVPGGTVADNLKTLALAFAAYESAESRDAVNMNDFMKNHQIQY